MQTRVLGSENIPSKKKGSKSFCKLNERPTVLTCTQSEAKCTIISHWQGRPKALEVPPPAATQQHIPVYRRRATPPADLSGAIFCQIHLHVHQSLQGSGQSCNTWRAVCVCSRSIAPCPPPPCMDSRRKVNFLDIRLHVPYSPPHPSGRSLMVWRRN